MSAGARSSVDTSVPAEEDSALPRSPYLIAVVCGMAAFMEVLDMSVANVSLVHIAGSLSASREEATWVLTSYLVANAIILPMTGWLADRIGRKRYYLGSLALFTLASLGCGLAPSLEFLVGARILQGLAGGALQPVSQAILNESFPPEKRGMAIAVYGLAVIVGPALGPTLGGFLTDQYSWHWIFLINIPVGVVLLMIGNRLLHDSPAQRERQRAAETRGIDYLGFAFISVAVGSLQLMLDLGQQEDWFESDLIRILAAVFIATLLLTIWRELTHEHPIINLRLLRDRNFAVGNLMIAAMYGTLMGATVMLPLMMQSLLGYSALQAGLVLSPAAALMAVMMPIVGRITGRVDERLLTSIGFILVCVAMLALAEISLDVSREQLMWLRFAQLAGVALLFIPVSGIAFAHIAPRDQGNASAIFNLSRNLGGSIGVSLLTTYLARLAQSHQAHLVDRFTPLDPAYQDAMATATRVAGDPLAAQALLATQVARHAQLLAFLDNYRALALIAIGLLPVIWLARRAPSGKGAAGTGNLH